MFLTEFFHKFKSPNQDLLEQVTDISNALCAQKVLTQNLQDQLLGKNAYIEILQEQLDRLEKNETKIRQKKHLKLIDAVMKVFEETRQDMNYLEVFLKVDKSNLKDKKTNISSIKSTIYYLISLKKIENGAKRGTFKMKNSPWDPR